MSKKIGFLMDPIEKIKPHKDTTFAFMLKAQERGHEIIYMQMQDVWLENGRVLANVQSLKVTDRDHGWFQVLSQKTIELTDLDLLLMRKDPPFDMNYIYMTYLLEIAEKAGLRVLNKPQSLRDANEKLFAAWFPQCCPETLVTASPAQIKKFIAPFDEAILKPLDGMGGHNIYRIKKNSPEIDAVNQFMMVQRFIPEIKHGDKRILLINGNPVDYVLARIPAVNDFRGNLAQGAIGEVRELTERDHWICQQVGPTLRAKGLYFVGLDVIGDYLTEINVTSPTCVREIESEKHVDICGQFFDGLDL